MAITTEIEAALVLCSALSAKAKGLLASVQSVDFTSNIIWPQGPPNGLLQADLVEAAARAVELAAAAEGSRGEGSRAQDEGGKANCKSPGEDHRQALWLRMSQEDAQLLKDAQLQHAQALQQQENVHRVRVTRLEALVKDQAVRLAELQTALAQYEKQDAEHEEAPPFL